MLILLHKSNCAWGQNPSFSKQNDSVTLTGGKQHMELYILNEADRELSAFKLHPFSCFYLSSICWISQLAMDKIVDRKWIRYQLISKANLMGI